MQKKLHPTQKQLLELLSKQIDDPLTYREIMDMLDISSTSVVAHHIGQLEKKGYIFRNPSNPRDYQILTGEPEKQVAYMNLYGLVYCGATGSLLDGNPIDRIPIPTRILNFPSKEGFLVEAKGDSMSPKIKEGDIVIARKDTRVESGTVAVCINQGEAIVKKVEIGKDNLFLVSYNPEYQPILAAEDFRVVGEVKGVFSHNID